MRARHAADAGVTGSKFLDQWLAIRGSPMVPRFAVSIESPNRTL
jgi:hypothetical protein